MKNTYYLCLFFALLISCDSSKNYIRDTYVNCEIDISLPEYSELNTIGNSIFIDNHGNRGLIIYHFAINVDDKYRVYDRNCSYENELSCAKIDSVNSNIAYCGCCSSAFLLDQNGQAVNSPAILPMKQYNWILNGTILHIFN